jgi:hypothetical protein
MNVVLDQTEEWAGGRKTAEYGECFLRGNNGECASCANHAGIFAFRSQADGLLSVLYISALEEL